MKSLKDNQVKLGEFLQAGLTLAAKGDGVMKITETHDYYVCESHRNIALSAICLALLGKLGSYHDVYHAYVIATTHRNFHMYVARTLGVPFRLVNGLDHEHLAKRTPAAVIAKQLLEGQFVYEA